MRDDIILAFCEGKKPKDLIQKKTANPKTIYYYHSIYKEMVDFLRSDEFVNQMVKLLLKLRIKNV